MSGYIVTLLNKANEIISEREPWKMSGEIKKRLMIRVGYLFFNSLCALSAIIPEKVKELNSHLGFIIPGIIYEQQIIYSYDSNLRTYERRKKPVKVESKLKIGGSFNDKRTGSYDK